MKIKRFCLEAILALSLVILSVSCSGKVNLKANSDLSSDLEFSFQVGKSVFDLISQVNNAAGNIGDTDSIVIFNCDGIRDSFKDSDYQNVTVVSPNNQSVIIKGKVAAKDKQKYNFSSTNVTAGDFIEVTANSLKFTISTDNIDSIVSALDEESLVFLELTMAPIFTGDDLSQEEYLEGIEMIYGTYVMEDIKKGEILITLSSPDGKVSKSFHLPLAEFLCLEETKTYSINW